VGADIQIIEPEWSALPGVRAAFTLRSGGVSVAPYDSLNLGAGVGDSAEAVAENRRRVREQLRLPAEPVWLEQVHGTEVVDVTVRGGVPTGDVLVGADLSRSSDASHGGDASRRVGASPRADACVVRAPGAVCAIRVADCMPVLFAAQDGSAVGAAHAGWRGLAGGVLEATVERLGVLPSQLVAWMGPAIGPHNFEVGDDVRAAFMKWGSPLEEADVASAFVRNDRGRWQCDLYALARHRLRARGVSRIFGGGWCTYADSSRFFSYRRDGQCGRMAALIWITGPSRPAC
jgi:YfiH family protein